MAQSSDRRALDTILPRFDKLQRAGNGWKARCPAHEDRNPSLSISEGTDGRVLLHCHAGCTLESICIALNIDEAELFPPKDTPRREIASYHYEDETGRHLFDVVRFHPKDFRQRRASGTWGLGDTRRVIYRLPQVRAAIGRGDPIYIAEGEKDVQALEQAGATATCNPMGAGKWRDDYSDQLDGATNITIVADNDEAGIAHATQIAASLQRHDIPHRIVLPAEGKDATEHLSTGNTISDFVPRIPASEPNRSPVVVETWREFAQKATQDVPCIIEGLWPEGAIGFIASPPKKGKTWIALALALSVATGRDYLNAFPVTTPRPVLYIALEGHRSALTHRIGAMARGMGIDPDDEIPNLHLLYKPRGINMADPVWADQISSVAQEINTQLLIVDVLRAAAVIKENSADDFAALITNLAPLLDGTRSLAFLHHFTKLSETTKERDPGERMSGSGAMYGVLDVGIFITGSENGARKLRLAFESRDIASPDAIGIELDGKGSGRNGGLNYHDRAWWSVIDAPEEDDVDVSAEDIKEWLIENGPATRAQIAGVFEISEKTVARREIRLLQLGVETRKRAGKATILIAQPPANRQENAETDPGQDTLDTCPTSGVSDLNPFIQAKNEVGQDTPDTNGVSHPKNGSEQGFPTPDTLDSPTERDPPVSGVSPEHTIDVFDPKVQAMLDDDIPF